MQTYLTFEPLSPALVERGTVEKSLVFAKDSFSVSVLKLQPGAKIRKHRHTCDNEKYIFESGEVHICIKGNEHELANDTDKELKVLAVKWA